MANAKCVQHLHPLLRRDRELIAQRVERFDYGASDATVPPVKLTHLDTTQYLWRKVFSLQYVIDDVGREHLVRCVDRTER